VDDRLVFHLPPLFQYFQHSSPGVSLAGWNSQDDAFPYFSNPFPIFSVFSVISVVSPGDGFILFFSRICQSLEARL
jgi:hypothetical protein